MPDGDGQPLKRNRFKRLVGFIVMFILGVCIGGAVLYVDLRLALKTSAPTPPSNNGEVRQNDSKYKLTNPLLECDLGQELLTQGNSKPTKATLSSMINKAKSQGDVSFVSLYYRDLNNGPWIGFNEKEKFYPASLLKVPIMLSYYRRAMDDPSVLTQRVEFEGGNDDTSDQYYKPDVLLAASTTYSVEDLIEHSIIYSDNAATLALTQLAGTGTIQAVFDDLHVEFPPSATTTSDFLTVKDYGMFFRVLFNASYLDPEMSEKALSLLTQATFNKGLTARLPRDIVVAHKFGEYTIDATSEKQLHDCGIVYVPKHPYMLCIMTRGDDFDRQAGVIADLSREVYDEVSSQ